MKEKALDIRKKILQMKDAYEQLSLDEREELAKLQKEHDDTLAQLSDEDTKWYEDELSKWYEKYLDVSTCMEFNNAVDSEVDVGSVCWQAGGFDVVKNLCETKIGSDEFKCKAMAPNIYLFTNQVPSAERDMPW